MSSICIQKKIACFTFLTFQCQKKIKRWICRRLQKKNPSNADSGLMGGGKCLRKNHILIFFTICIRKKNLHTHSYIIFLSNADSGLKGALSAFERKKYEKKICILSNAESGLMGGGKCVRKNCMPNFFYCLHSKKIIYRRVHIFFSFQMQIVDLRVHYLHSKEKRIWKKICVLSNTEIELMCGGKCVRKNCMLNFFYYLHSKKNNLQTHA